MHNLQNRLTSRRGAFGGREDSNGLLSSTCILFTMDIDSSGGHKERGKQELYTRIRKSL